nr:reverse transcriptase domain-containing protein [Tanacetum cinerariifolium]
NTITNPKEDLKVITTCSGTAYQGHTIPTTSSSLSQVVERENEVTKDTVPPTNNESTKDIQPLVFQTETPILNYEPVVAPIIEPVVAPVSALKPNQKSSISSRADPTLLNDFEMVAKGNDDPPVPDLQTMEELYQPSLNGRGGPIAPIAIQATNFGLKYDMIQQVQNSPLDFIQS